MNKIISIIFIQFLILWSSIGLTQTPITNTPFYKAYEDDFHIVSVANQKGVLDKDILFYLTSDKISNDLKAAIINAISFDIIGKDNTKVFLDYLALLHNIPRKDVISSDLLSASEIMCIGYLLIMDDYFNTTDAFYMMEKAFLKNSSDYTINVLYRLLEAHDRYIEDPCSALHYLDYFPSKKTYNDYLLPEAEKIIMDYFENLKVKCR